MMRAVERALSIFDAFDVENPVLTTQGIGNRIGLSKATTYRLVNSLNDCGYLVRVDNHKYSLSMKFVRLAGLVRKTLSVRDVAHPIMVEVSEATGETAGLNTLSGNERICIEVVETPAALMHIVKPGEHVSLPYGATGRILMAYMDARQRDKVLNSTKDKSLNRKTLITQLKRFRRQGYSHIVDERAVGVTALSVPLFSMEGRVNDCLTLSGPSARMDPRIEEFAGILVKAGANISSMLGARTNGTK